MLFRLMKIQRVVECGKFKIVQTFKINTLKYIHTLEKKIGGLLWLHKIIGHLIHLSTVGPTLRWTNRFV